MKDLKISEPTTYIKTENIEAASKANFIKNKWLKCILAFLFIFFFIPQIVFAHAVQVGYAVLPNGFIRVYIEHWHGDQSVYSLRNNGMSITTKYGGKTVTQNVNPSGAFNNTSRNNLPGAGSNLQILSSSWYSANRYNDWAYYDFAPAACNVPVEITLNGGLTVVLTESQSHIWPQTITGTFNDTAGPTITPSNTNAIVSCGETGANVNFSATAIDNCTANLDVTYDKAPGSFFPIGTTQVTASSTDDNGNTSQITFPVTVTLTDNIAPIAKVKDIVVELDANGRANITAEDIDNQSSDNCGNVSLALNRTNFSCSDLGENTVRLTVTDSNGNVATKDAIVKVEDNIAPVVKAQGVTVILSNGMASITPEMINNGSQDNCGIASISLDNRTFDCSNIGENTVTLTVTDNNGNEATATAIVNVIGAVPAPSIAVSPSSDVYTGGDANTIYLGYGPQSVMLSASNATSEPGVSTYSWTPVEGLSSTSIANPVFTPTSAGIHYFTVTATNEYGCSSSTDIAINVVDASCGKKGNKVLVCHKGKEICIAPSAVQAHLAHGCSLGACSTNALQATNSSNSVGMQEEGKLVAFPNPFSNQANFEFSLTNAGKYRLEMYDVRGALISVVAEGEGEAGSYHSFEISGNKLAKGIYMMRLVTADGIKNAKIIKNR